MVEAERHRLATELNAATARADKHRRPLARAERQIAELTARITELDAASDPPPAVE